MRKVDDRVKNILLGGYILFRVTCFSGGLYGCSGGLYTIKGVICCLDFS